MSRTLRVSVTRADIRTGRPGSARFCPHAFAIRRALLEAGIADAIAVSSRGVWKLPLMTDDTPTLASLPPAARDWITKYDARLQGEDFVPTPIRYTIRVDA